jgi:hypothetical protein
VIGTLVKPGPTIDVTVETPSPQSLQSFTQRTGPPRSHGDFLLEAKGLVRNPENFEIRFQETDPGGNLTECVSALFDRGIRVTDFRPSLNGRDRLGAPGATDMQSQLLFCVPA